MKGLMHDYGISNLELAQKLDVTSGYVASIFTEKKNPPDREERFRKAVGEIIAERRGAK